VRVGLDGERHRLQRIVFFCATFVELCGQVVNSFRPKFTSDQGLNMKDEPFQRFVPARDHEKPLKRFSDRFLEARHRAEATV